MKINVLYVFESTKFTTAGRIDSVLLVSGATPGPVVGEQVQLEPGIYRITDAATLNPAVGPTFVVSLFDKGDGLPDPPGKIVAAFTNASTTAAQAMNTIKSALAGQGVRGSI